MKKKMAVYTLLSTMMFSSFVLAPVAHADSYDSKIEDTQKQIQESQNTINNLDENIRGLQSQKSSTESELNSINKSISANEEKIQKLVVQLEKSQKEMEQLQAELKVLNENIEKRNAQLEEQARTVQVDGDPANYIEFIVEAESFSDVIGRVDIVSSLVRANKTLVQEQKRDKEAVQVKEKRTEETIVQQNATANQLEETSVGLEQQRLEKEVLVAQLASETASAQSERDAHLAVKAEAETRVANYVAAKEEAEQAAQLAYEQRQAEEEAAQQVAVASQPAEEAESEEAVVSQSSSNESSTSDSSNNQSSSNSTAPSSSSSSNSSSNSSSSNSSSSNSSNSTTNTAPSKPAASKPAVSKPKPKPAAPKPTPPKKEEAKKPAPTGNVISYALSLTGQGIKYSWGGSTPAGFDCSGFTSYVFNNTRGVSLPRSAAGQYASSTKVSSPVAGDLVFFAGPNGKGSVTHVGIYIGGGQFVGSQSSTGPGVKSVNDPYYWGTRLVGYGRY